MEFSSRVGFSWGRLKLEKKGLECDQRELCLKQGLDSMEWLHNLDNSDYSMWLFALIHCMTQLPDQGFCSGKSLYNAVHWGIPVHVRNNILEYNLQYFHWIYFCVLIKCRHSQL